MMKKMNNQSNPRKRERGLSMSAKRTESECTMASSGYAVKQQRAPLTLTSSKPAGGAQYLLAKGPDGTRGFYSRSKKLNAKAHEFVPSFR
ncbi:hypothetical protein LEN26_020079 [Aphanomyces euteiches]|nr:hypothetical protein LEN26_020079 [Aphanomyces euteiches]KAH9115337.1 hypothetical protein AeMF1_010603 [Aphanomyces euteiches]KAH9133511.1 hypothetical protein AeRB84_020414 [Aphanomyces euteiches]KAH9196732.1 hypothetical protein AeNC1_001306 [Aphanomyces euteiches]